MSFTITAYARDKSGNLHEMPANSGLSFCGSTSGVPVIVDPDTHSNTTWLTDHAQTQYAAELNNFAPVYVGDADFPNFNEIEMNGTVVNPFELSRSDMNCRIVASGIPGEATKVTMKIAKLEGSETNHVFVYNGNNGVREMLPGEIYQEALTQAASDVAIVDFLLTGQPDASGLQYCNFVYTLELEGD